MSRGTRQYLLAVLMIIGVVFGFAKIAEALVSYLPDSAPTCNISCDKSSLASGESATLSITDWLDMDEMLNDEGGESGILDSLGYVVWRVISGPATLDSGSGPSITLHAGTPDEDTTVTVEAAVYDSGTKGVDTVQAGQSDLNPKPSVVKQIQVPVQATKIATIKVTQKSSDNKSYDITADTVYVAKGKTLTFKAIPDPANAAWPSDKPIWGGAANGTGDTKEVKFDTIGNTTVTATCVNTKTVNIVVGTFSVAFVPSDLFDGRSLVRVGVEETGLLCVIPGDGLSLSNLKPMTWTKISGTATVLEWTDEDTGLASLIAGDSAGSDTYKLTANGTSVPCTVTVTPPTATRMTRVNPDVAFHLHNEASAGIALYYWLDPTDVSFSKIKFGEGTCHAINKTGIFSTPAGDPHDHPASYFGAIMTGNISTGCRVVGDDHAFVDRPVWGSGGTFTWSIPTYWYDSAGTGHLFGNDSVQTAIIEANGDTTQNKSGQSSGPIHANAFGSGYGD